MTITRCLFSAFAIAAAVSLVACQGKEFEGKKAVAAAPTNPPSGATGPGGAQNPTTAVGPSSANSVTGTTTTTVAGGATTMTSGAAGVVFAPDVQEVDAMKKCLNQWTVHPFSTVNKQNSKVTEPGISGFGIQIGGSQGNQGTPEPQLIVVSPTLNILGQPTYKLLNPNGWYCLKLDLSFSDKNNLANTKWIRECNAKVAESEIDLNFNTTGQIIGDTNKTGGQLGVIINAGRNMISQKQFGGACQ